MDLTVCGVAFAWGGGMRSVEEEKPKLRRSRRGATQEKDDLENDVPAASAVSTRRTRARLTTLA